MSDHRDQHDGRDYYREKMTLGADEATHWALSKSFEYQPHCCANRLYKKRLGWHNDLCVSGQSSLDANGVNLSAILWTDAPTLRYVLSDNCQIFVLRYSGNHFAAPLFGCLLSAYTYNITHKQHTVNRNIQNKQNIFGEQKTHYIFF